MNARTVQNENTRSKRECTPFPSSVYLHLHLHLHPIDGSKSVSSLSSSPPPSPVIFISISISSPSSSSSPSPVQLRIPLQSIFLSVSNFSKPFPSVVTSVFKLVVQPLHCKNCIMLSLGTVPRHHLQQNWGWGRGVSGAKTRTSSPC